MPRAVLLPALLLSALSLSSALALGCGKADSAPARIELDDTGVAECDDYVAKLSRCAERLPPEQRPAHQASIRQARDLFEDKADTDEGELALKTACKQMTEALAERSLCN